MIKCPLCGAEMHQYDSHYICSNNNLHTLPVSDWDRYYSGEKDVSFLRWRMKVYLGKKIHGR